MSLGRESPSDYYSDYDYSLKSQRVCEGLEVAKKVSLFEAFYICFQAASILYKLLACLHLSIAFR